MISWKNLDTLAAYGKLNALKNHVNLQEVMSGENGAKRVAEYSLSCGTFGVPFCAVEAVAVSA